MDSLLPPSAIADAQGKKAVNPPAMQTALDWRPDGTAAVTTVDANSVARERAQRRETLRGDARRTAEYLASRGRTPIEALHDLAKLGWRVGTREIAKELGCSKREAMPLWFRAVESILPYTAARIDALELGQSAAAGMGLGHYLAARAVSDMLALERQAAAPGGAAGAPSGPLFAASIVTQTIDATETAGAVSPSGADTAPIPSALPPLAPD